MKVLLALLLSCCAACALTTAPSTYGIARWQFGAKADYFTVYVSPTGTPLAPKTSSTTWFAYVYGLIQGRSYHWAVSATVNGVETPKSPEKSFTVPLRSPKANSL